ILGGIDLRLDPWQSDYGVEVSLGGGPEAAPDKVDLGPEVPRDRWQPLAPGPDARLADRLVFVDGVRRVEARVMGRMGDRLVHGAFGTFAVGTVVVEGGCARWGGERVER